jgi:hypothetical protein
VCLRLHTGLLTEHWVTLSEPLSTDDAIAEYSRIYEIEFLTLRELHAYGATFTQLTLTTDD